MFFTSMGNSMYVNGGVHTQAALCSIALVKTFFVFLPAR